MELRPDALDFLHPTDVLVIEVGGITISNSFQDPSFGENIRNLLIQNSTLARLTPTFFSRKLSLSALVIVRTLLSVDDTEVGRTDKFLFYPKEAMSLVRIENCSIATTDKVTFIRARAHKVEIVGNTLRLEGSLESSLDLTGNQVRLIGNKIHTKIDRAITVETKEELLVEANELIHNNSDVLDFSFPGGGLTSITIANSNLHRLKNNFINAKARQISIVNCKFKLDNEYSIISERVREFKFSNNEVGQMNTEAIIVNVTEKVEILGNIFEHCQEKVFYNIDSTENATFVFSNNTFMKFEDGFLKLAPTVEGNLGNSSLSDIILMKQCDCLLTHDIVTEDGIDLRSEAVHTEETENEKKREEKLETSIKCLNGPTNKLTSLTSFIRDSFFCRRVDDQDELRAVEGKTWIVWLVVGLVVFLVIVAICLYSIFKARLIERRMTQRAISRCHPVPASCCHPAPAPCCHPAPASCCHPAPASCCHPDPASCCHPAPAL